MTLISSTIKEQKAKLYYFGIVRPNKLWQGVELKYKMLEMFNIFLTLDIPHEITELISETNADIPWAEDHFDERIGREPLNPGNQWKNWPYYRDMDNDRLFRNDREGNKFSHTYMERMWCKGYKGIGYEFGDFNDFLVRFLEDPYGRQHYFSIWHPEDQSPGSRRRPCTIGYFFQIVNMKLECTYHIRSCDIFRHFHNDIYMTGRLMQYVWEAMTEVLPYLRLGNLYMWIGNLHCFEPEKPLLLR